MKRFVALVAGVGLAVLWAGPASAHAAYKSSNPADESTVSSPPSQITAEFTEPMTSGSYMDVTDPCGQDVGSDSTQSGSSMTVNSSGTAAGTYSVFWRAVSIDSHVTEGQFTFTATGGDACPGEEKEERDTTKSQSRDSSTGTTPSQPGSGSNGGSSVSNSNTATTRHHHHHAGVDTRHGAGGKRSNSGDSEAPKTFAEGTRSDVPDAPSALEGIPIGGLVMTLIVAALLGAAAGRIFVLLSDGR